MIYSTPDVDSFCAFCTSLSIDKYCLPLLVIYSIPSILYFQYNSTFSVLETSNGTCNCLMRLPLVFSEYCTMHHLCKVLWVLKFCQGKTQQLLFLKPSLLFFSFLWPVINKACFVSERSAITESISSKDWVSHCKESNDFCLKLLKFRLNRSWSAMIQLLMLVEFQWRNIWFLAVECLSAWRMVKPGSLLRDIAYWSTGNHFRCGKNDCGINVETNNIPICVIANRAEIVFNAEYENNVLDP